MTPTQRSKKYYEDQGFLVGIVEKYNAFAGPPNMRCAGCGKNKVGVRQDLFGFADLLAVHPIIGTIAIQTTSGAGMPARRKKMRENPDKIEFCLQANWKIELHGWTPRKIIKDGTGTRSRVELRRESVVADEKSPRGFLLFNTVE